MVKGEGYLQTVIVEEPRRDLVGKQKEAEWRPHLYLKSPRLYNH